MIGPYTCYACGKRTKGTREFILTACLEDDGGRRVPVGPCCLRRIKACSSLAPFSYQPPKGGPKLYFNEKVRALGLANGISENA
jgi:hypothetical protein